MQNGIIEILNFIWLKICQFAAFIAQLCENGIKSLPYALSWLRNNSLNIGEWYCHIVRWVMPVLALIILTSIIRSMLKVKNPKETWAYLESDSLGRFPVTHWETLIGRSKICDIIIEFLTISKQHCALIFDGKKKWKVHDLSDDGQILINGNRIGNEGSIASGDTLSLGGVDFVFTTISESEAEIQSRKRSEISSISFSPVFSVSLLTVFQMLAASSLVINRPEHSAEIFISFTVFAAVMWAYTLMFCAANRKGLEPEILAFFLSSLCLSVTASSNPAGCFKQLAAILLGMAGFLFLSWYLRDLNRTMKSRYLMAGFTGLLLISSLIVGTIQNGAQNWVYIMGVSFQPSELAKICFVFAGAASLDRLFKRRNFWGFMVLSFFCFGTLALMSDFGTAAIFFITFLIIAFMRSGDYKTLLIICGSAVAAFLITLKFKPYIAARFSVWGHAWEHVSDTGYQQVRTMSAAASGGLIGVGSGNGWLHKVAAANTDLVFGMICEEWGLIIGILAILAIVSFAIFSVRVGKSGRSTYYVIAACAATSMLVFQTMLNVFGSLDLFPLTGVTFPFVSCGGSSMLAAWGLLAFVKAVDTRQGASFAVKKIRTQTEKLPEKPPSQKGGRRRTRDNGTIDDRIPDVLVRDEIPDFEQRRKSDSPRSFSETSEKANDETVYLDEVTGLYNRGERK